MNNTSNIFKAHSALAERALLLFTQPPTYKK